MRLFTNAALAASLVLASTEVLADTYTQVKNIREGFMQNSNLECLSAKKKRAHFCYIENAFTMHNKLRLGD